jgi:3-deoxy-D-manno-octulosonic-acid transferase
MYLVYEVALYLVLVLGLPFFLLRGKYTSTFAERMGHYLGAARAHDVWIHAVSVGETLAAKPVVDAMMRLRPSTSLVVTTTTATGQAQAKKLFPFATVTYFPLDFSVAVKRFLNHHRPRLFAAMETEIWPNATRLAAARGVRLVLANGRISDRSFPRYRMFRAIVARVLRHYDAILAREAQDAERFRAIGAREVEVAGNVKFDYVPDERPLEFDLLALAAGRPIVVLGSTMEGEDEALLPAVLPLGAFVVVAPRKPDRFDVVASLAPMTRRSALTAAAWPPHSTLLLDTIGELARVYRYATAAFIGGSLVPTGGHNPIEAAAAGVPTCFGPHMSNFREIASVFLRDGAAEEVRSARDVAAFFRRMTDDERARAAIGETARRTVAENRGAAERTARRIVELLQ